ncbi:hypothetical protein GGI07_004596 [Coemansia sp. Benny D115]|nr:hypothetical protein GGI07_004596 [Coemansia sp. Benny D115]
MDQQPHAGSETTNNPAETPTSGALASDAPVPLSGSDSSAAAVMPDVPASLEPGMSASQADRSSSHGLETGIGGITLSESSTNITAGLGALPISAPMSFDSSLLGGDLDLGFNVDSLNLENLSGLDFDVSSLLSQVSGASMAAVAGALGAGATSAADTLFKDDAATAAAATVASTAPIQQLKLSTKPADSQPSIPTLSPASALAPTSATATATAPAISTSAGAPASAMPNKLAPANQTPAPAATPAPSAAGAVPTQNVQKAPAAPAASSAAAPQTSERPPQPQLNTLNTQPGSLGAQSSGPAAAQTSPSPRPPANPLVRPMGPGARPTRPPTQPPSQPGAAPPRPRPMRPAGTALPNAAQGAPPRPVVAGAAGSPTTARPAGLVSPGGARPPALRPGHPGAPRPRPVVGPGSPVRPGMRPLMRPRPVMRPQQLPAGVSPTAPRPVMRPGARPVPAPASATARPPPPPPAAAANSTSFVNSSVSAPVSTSSAPAPAPAPAATTAAAATIAATTTATATTAAATATAAPSEGPTAASQPLKIAQPMQPPSAVNTSSKATGEDEDERLLTESVLVSSPPPIAAARGLEALYGHEGSFRALCHGFLPTNAEWSTQNIVAVTWPQLETSNAGAGQRFAQRDVSDVLSLTAADNMRTAADWRPVSAAVHLFRLHAKPPPAWDMGARLRPMAPSLLPLCDLRMQQQWDGALEDTAPTIDDGSSLNVAPLSGWHGGASQAGLGEHMRVASAPRCTWSADSRMLAVCDRAGRFELFQAGAELNAWRSVYHVDFDCPVVACLWLAGARKYGISRDVAASTDSESEPPVSAADSAASGQSSRWSVDPSISIKRLPFFGPRNTQGEYALLILTANGQLVLIYQRDEAWARVVSPLEPRHRDVHPAMSSSEEDTLSARDDPWSNIPKGAITHADMMLVSKKWIYMAAHRADASTVTHPHEPGAIPDALKHDGGITAPTVEVYRIQVEFASDYSPRLFATPLVVQPVTLPPKMAQTRAPDTMDVDSVAEDLAIPRVTHIKLITALNPEVRPVEKNILGENHYFPLLFVSLGRMGASTDAHKKKPACAKPDADFTTFIQVWRLEGAAHAQRSVVDLLRRPPPLKLLHTWTEQRQGLLLAVNANRAERQQLRYLFAKPSEKDYRALMLTWADGRVEMLRNYTDQTDRFDQCVQPVRASEDCVIGSALSPHYTAFFQLVVRPCVVELGASSASAGASTGTTGTGTGAEEGGMLHNAVSCTWNQGHTRIRLGWTPFFSERSSSKSSLSGGLPAASPLGAPVQAYCGDLLAVRILNQEDPTDLVALLANMAAHEENQPMPMHKTGENPPDSKESDRESSDALLMPVSRTLAQALHRACTLMANALGTKSIELDPLASSTPFVRRLLGAIMQTHFLAQHNIQATTVGLLLHVAAVVEARVTIVHEHILQGVSANHSFHDLMHLFSDDWRRTFPAAAALVLWCIDLFVALIRDTYLYLNVRCPDSAGNMRRLCDLDSATASCSAHEQEVLRSFRGEAAEKPDADGSFVSDDQCLLASGLPSRLALIFHRPTLDAIRNLMTFVAHIEHDLVRRIQILNNLPPNAANIPEYASMLQARDMIVSTTQQMAHALEYLPVSMQRMKDFLTEVQDLYSADPECMSLSAQAVLVATSTIAGPFRKHLPAVARSFSHFILERDVVDTFHSRPAAPSALVLHDTRWLAIVSCRAGASGLADGTTVFETPWRVRLPVRVADSKLIETDEDALVPAAELAEWEKEKSEFERALDEDNVLFDIDDPGFIFFDTSEPPSEAAMQMEGREFVPPLPQAPGTGNAGAATSAYGAAFAAVAGRAAAMAPVKITTKVPDFSSVLGPMARGKRPLMPDMDGDLDFMFDMPNMLESAFAPNHLADISDSASGGNSAKRHQSRTRSNSATTFSPCMTPRTVGFGMEPGSSFSWTSPAPFSLGLNNAASGGRNALTIGRHGAAQHFVPHYSNVAASSWATAGKNKGKEMSSGWQFISTPRDPKLHIPTLLAQHAYSLAVLYHKRNQAKRHQLDGGSEEQQQQQPARQTSEGGQENQAATVSSSSSDECEDLVDLDQNGMSYCIDWSRSEGVVIESSSMQPLPGISTSQAADSTAERQNVDSSGGYFARTLSGTSVDRVDVVQKTLLPVDAPARMCLRCGHATRKTPVAGSKDDVAWIHRYDILCVCGGSWIAI